MKQIFSLVTTLFLGFNLAWAQMVVTVVPKLNTSVTPDKIDFEFYVRSGGTAFNLGACNFVFDYDNTAIQTGSATLVINHLTAGCPSAAPCFDMTVTNTPGFLNLTVAPFDFNQSVNVTTTNLLIATVRCNILDCSKNIGLTPNSAHNYSIVNATFDDFIDITSGTTFDLPTAFPLRPQLYFVAPKDTSVCSGANVTFYTQNNVFGDFYIGIPGAGSRTPLVANSWNASHTFTFPGPGTRVDTIILTTRNVAGNTYCEDLLLVTVNPLPAVPTATAATGINCTGFTANWTSVSGATDYRLDVATDAGFSSMVSGYNDLSVGIVTVYNVTGLSLGTTYYYRVRSVNGCGVSVNSNVITVTTDDVPAVPTATAATGINCTGFTANWASVIGATNYTLEVSLDAGHSSPVSGSPFTVSGTGQVITGLSAGTTYYFRVRSNNACGSSTFTANETVTTNAISGVPTGLSSSGVSCTGFTANWTSVIGATNYTLEVSLDAGHSSPVSGSPFTVSGTGQVITGLTPSTTYYFRVRSNNACGSSAFTGNQMVITTAGTMPSFIAPTITVWENQKQVTYTTNIACDWVLSGCTSTSPLLGTTSIVVDFDLPGIATITATPSSVTCPISGNLSLMVLPTYKIDVRVWLEGPYSGGTMTVSAIRNGQLNSAWGGIMTPTRPDTFGWPDTAMTNSYNVPANAIDLILLELRTGTALATKVDTALAWLMNDGTVRDFATGTKSYAELRRNAGGTYYVVVRSRNHAPIRSANSAAITNVAGGPGTLFDMKTAAGISNPSLNAKDLGGGQLGMYAGQVNPIFGRKNEINSVDFFYVRKRAAGAPVGYLIEDVNDDGVCNAADYILTSQNNDYLRRSDVDD